jgi:hypothetical protein
MDCRLSGTPLPPAGVFWAHLRRDEVAFAPICALKGKRGEKHGEKRRKSGGERRKMAPFRGPKAPFRSAPFPLHSVAIGRSARPYVRGVRPPRSASRPADRKLGAIFRGPGHETTYVGKGSVDDCVGFAARVGRPARSKATGSCGFDVGRIGNPSRESLGSWCVSTCRPSVRTAKGSTSERARAVDHQATAPRAPLNEYERVKALTDRELRRRPPGARSEICSSSVVLGRPRSALF